MLSPKPLAHRGVLFLLTVCAFSAALAGIYKFLPPASASTSRETTAARPAIETSAPALVSATIVVNSTADTINTSDGLCTLREAIAAANTDSVSGPTVGECAAGSGSDTIDMTGVSGTITLTTALPAIATDMTLTGPGANQLTVARSTAGGTPNFRIFTVASLITASISGMTITNGSTADGVQPPSSSFGNPGDPGGGIMNSGVLTLTNMTITGNRTGNGSLPAASSSGSNFGGPGGAGGGIYSSGQLNMSNVTVSNNTTGDGVSAIFGGGGGSGGGIFINSGSLTMTNCLVSGNATGIGAISTNGASSGTGGEGGGINVRVGTITITTTSIINNTTGTTQVASPSNSGSGGGGGGIMIASGAGETGTVTITNCTISGNRTGDGTGFSGQAGRGAGLNNGSSSNLTITGTTISGNQTGNGVNGAEAGIGAGLSNTATTKIINSTISGNVSGTGNSGAGPGIWNATNLFLTNSTVVLNTGGTFGGPGIHQFNNSSAVTLRNTIIAGNSLSGQPNAADLSSGGPAYNSQGHNLIGNADGATGFSPANGDQLGPMATPLDPRLSPLANNGGPTLTHALLPGSPAIDAGDDCVLTNSCSPPLSAALTTDQRGAGFDRALNGNSDGIATVDIGAYEAKSILVTNTTDSGLGSLRQAIIDANAQSGTDAIYFESGLTGTITLLSALPALSTSMEIIGPGANLIMVMRSTAGGTPNFRIFFIESGLTVSISGLTIANGNVGNGLGAGVLNNGILTLTNCNFYGNNASSGGGGGAIFSGVLDNVPTSLTVNNCNIGGMAAGQPNGASNGGGIFMNSGPLTMIGGSVVGNSNHGFSLRSGPVILSGVTIANNTSPNDVGGGILAGGVTANIINCLIAGNSADLGGGGVFSNAGAVSLVNTTVSGNSSFGSGGGVDHQSGTLTLINSTITNNRSDSNNSGGETGGGIRRFDGTVTLHNTIVAGNFRGTGSTADDISGLVDSTSSFNLLGDGGAGGLQNTVNGNKQVSDPRLGPLANNGGSTQTHALLPGSLALDAGDNSFVINPPFPGSAPFTDQRGAGFKRILDSADINDTTQTVDIGAFEAHPMIMVFPDHVFYEDFPESFTSYSVGDDSEGFSSIVGTSSNQSLLKDSNFQADIPNSFGSRSFSFALEPNQSGTTTLTITITGSNGQSVADSFLLTVTPVADTPSVTNATTNEDTQTTSGLVISRNAADGSEVTHFKITGITNGTLFKNNGTTQISNGAFITFAEGNAGLKFTPTANLFSPTTAFSFNVQAATDSSGSGLSPATAGTITVTPIADTPSITSASTIVNTQTTSGLVISRNAVDGNEVTHFKITNITNGTLFKNNGTTQITNDSFITFAEGDAGLKFTPSDDLVSPSSTFGFQAQGATSSGGAGLGSATTATITVNCGPTIVTNTNDSGAGSLRTIINTACPGANITFNIPTSDPRFVGGVYNITLTSAELAIHKNLTITGLGANVLTVRRSTAGGTPNFRIFTTNSTSITISGITITNGRGPNATSVGLSGGPGGGIENTFGSTLNLRSVVITGNRTGDGGGGAGVGGGSGGGLLNSGVATISNSTISNNVTGFGGNGFGPGGVGGGGGGITNFGTMTVINSTISGNQTGNGGNGSVGNSGGDGGSGAGIVNASGLTLINTTIVNNHTGNGGAGPGNASSGGRGAGISSSGNLTVINCTIAGNQTGIGGNGGPGGSGGGIWNQSSFTVNFANTIVAGNLVGFAGGGPDLSGNFNSQDYNLIGNISGALFDGTTDHNIINQSASLGALANNGGPTQTMLPMPGSRAINAGSNANLPADTFDLDSDSNTSEQLPVDQRGVGFARIVNTTVDIGAVEVNYTISATAGTPQSAVFNTTFATALQATVKEYGNNQSGIPVTFTPPASGASGSFTGSATVNTNAGGVATAPVFTANGTVGGPYNVVASLAGGSPSANFSLTNLKANQTITFNALVNKTFGDADFNVSATASSGLAVSFTASGQCTISGTLVHITGVGTCTITAKQAGNTNYNAAPDVPRAFTIAKANQTITFNALLNKTFGNADFNVSATASSGLAVSFTASGQCTISGTLVHITAPGSCTITAKQAGNTNYNAAPDVPRAFTIAKANQTITFNALLNKTFGNADFNVSATASSGLAVSFTASGQCTISGTLVHITAAGSCTITAKQAGNTNYNAAPDVPRAFTIAKAATTTAVSSSVNPSEFGQSVTFTATVTSAAGTPTGTVQFKDGAANIGSLQTLTGGVAQVTTSSLSPGPHTITADYSGDANFLISTGSLSGGQTVTSQRTLSIGDVSVTEGNSGTANLTFTVTLSAASSLTVTVKYDTADGSATIADSDYQLKTGTLTFNPGDPLTKTVTVLVNGDQKTELDETVFVVLSNPVNAAFSDSQATGTILNDDTLQLLLDTSGPDANQLAALDSLLLTRDPFRVQNPASWFTSDQNTRVILFALNLQLGSGESSSVVKITLVDGNGQPQEVAAEDVRSIADTAFTQVTFRLPDGLAPGTCLVNIKAHERISNSGTFRIAP